MRAPARVTHLPALRPAAAALALCSTIALSADEARDERIQAIQSSLPHYDPRIREKYLATQAALPASPAEHGVAGPAAAGNGTSGTASADAIELPKMTVHPELTVPKPLPRLTAPKPLHDLKGEPLESGSARDARLIKKHISRLVQFLNPHAAVVDLARAAEAREKKANDLNGLADGVELDEALGRDPEQIKKVRDEFEKLYYSGPK